jgi:fructokinase
MFLVCGEALMDVFVERETACGMGLDARIGGSPLNVAIGLARLGQQVDFLGALSGDALGGRIRRALDAEGVGLGYTPTLEAPTTLGMVSLNAQGSPEYSFYGHGCADRMLRASHLPALGENIKALHFGSYTMVAEPVAATHRLLVERERSHRVIAYDPNVRLHVVPEIERWTGTLDWMAQRTHLLKVSSEDISLLYPHQSIHSVAEGWLRQGVLVVVVTYASKGVMAFTSRGTVGADAVQTQVVDTVGAGDTFQAALLTWLAENDHLSVDALASISNKDIGAALRFASMAAAITCGRRGADLPRRNEISDEQLAG